MMIICEKCGTCDDIELMYSVADNKGESHFVCEGCAKDNPSAVRVSEIKDALGRTNENIG